MIRLTLTATPRWLDLAPGLRLLLAPLDTRAMVTARDPVMGGASVVIGGQFHLEPKSNPLAPHTLFPNFVLAALYTGKLV